VNIWFRIDCNNGQKLFVLSTMISVIFSTSTVTLDYKALLLLLNKTDDEDFLLGGKGYGVEFCAFCDAIRVSYMYQIL